MINYKLLDIYYLNFSKNFTKFKNIKKIVPAIMYLLIIVKFCDKNYLNQRIIKFELINFVH